jgi:heme-degrading monooxygenase HmoA
MSKYAVIFRAEINQLDSLYSETAARMRSLAINEYGCTEFFSSTEGNTEVAISYWPSLERIQAWKNNPEHQKAQSLGMSKWYKSHQVQIVEILREYAHENT